MCSYLYAMFGLKTREADGLLPDELAAVRRWHSAILSVAIDEMAHLGLVANIQCALSVRPHFGR
ncbi:MAG: hypothetical protein AVDCRST_MAG39-1342 [uncultured Sphingomonadaceae bacterium]|uniref:Iminophenyl-pyruvate dimer synthase domain-containing protein n=1 Tax=uncultured Sphingomonadaceae bacterium TaxID=169976 RepID=A0A6J4SKB4_9SPHN|nr:MAG: hypothetical protein AVDCRST_MAG39-1342 [uncultured Sphingomonadaceae bacterium]